MTTQPAPLRRVVCKFYWPTVRNGIVFLGLYEGLECGHIQMKKHNLMGPYKAIRRRCEACRIMGKV